MRISPFCKAVKVLISFYRIYHCVLLYFHSRQAPIHQFYGMKSSGENFVGFEIDNISVTDIQRMNKWRQDWPVVVSRFVVRCVVCCGVCLKGADYWLGVKMLQFLSDLDMCIFIEVYKVVSVEVTLISHILYFLNIFHKDDF